MKIGHLQVQNNSGHITILPFNYDSIVQGTWVFNTSANLWSTHYLRNDSPADGDSMTFKVYLTKGTYTLNILSNRDTVCGIVDIDIDGVEVASIDAYNSSTIYNQLLQATDIEILSDGLKTITVRIDGKNASSTNYYIVFAALCLFRTA